MNKQEIAQQLAREGGISRAEAADQFDSLASELLITLKRGEPVKLPGLGAFTHVSGGRIRFEREGRARFAQGSKARG
jgi:nucleoid DNA-binding protein